jgi:thiamine biosynthesis protein ThiS
MNCLFHLGFVTMPGMMPQRIPYVYSGLRMKITLNGEPYVLELPAGTASTVATLVAHLGLELGKVAVEQNRTIVPRSLHGETPIRDGDEIEVVQFIGGG